MADHLKNLSKVQCETHPLATGPLLIDWWEQKGYVVYDGLARERWILAERDKDAKLPKHLRKFLDPLAPLERMRRPRLVEDSQENPAYEFDFGE